jgi:hypothetical protein
MNIPFQIQGDNFAIDANDDSQLYQLQLTNSQVPNAILVSIPVATSNTVVAVHASFEEFDSDAVVPVDGTPGRGIIVIPGAPTLFTLNTQAAANGNLYVSVAATANVTVYLSGVVI